MQKKADGQNYAPKGKSDPVCAPGEFPVGVIGLDHGHIFGMCNGLMEAGAGIDYVYDPDPEKIASPGLLKFLHDPKTSSTGKGYVLIQIYRP